MTDKRDEIVGDKPGQSHSRGAFLKRAGATAGAVVVGGGLTGTAGAATRRRTRSTAGTLNLLTWPGHGDKEFVGPFEKANNCKVKVKEYTGGEQMLAIANSTPLGTFDCVLLDREYVSNLKDAGKIETSTRRTTTSPSTSPSTASCRATGSTASSTR